MPDLTTTRIRLLRPLAISILVLAGAAYVALCWDKLALIAEVDMLELVTLSMSLLVFFVVTGFGFCLVVSTLGVRLSPVEWIGLTFISTMLNYSAPAHPGLFAKAVYLKKKKLSYSRFSVVMAAKVAISALSSGILGLLVLLLMWRMDGVSSPLLVLLCSALVLLAAMPLTLPLPRLTYQGKIWKLLKDAAQGLKELRGRRWRTLAFGCIVIVEHFLSAIICMIAFRAFGFELELLSALAIGVFVAIFGLFSLTPNNIGVQEIVMAYLYSVTGMDFTDGLIGGGLIRAVHMLLAFVMAPIFAHLLLSPTRLRQLTRLSHQNDPSELTVERENDEPL
ncbi:MAG: flippase-like domain-containing protein [bacterium]|nr:flippase-like domain-containing protein [bacterium]